MDGIVLLIIDMQNAMFANPTKQPCRGKEVLNNIQLLLSKSRELTIPVIYIQQTNIGKFKKGAPSWQIHSAIAPNKNELALPKAMPNSFWHTDLQQTLLQLKTHKVVIVGMQTEFCVKQTCKGAFRLGYDVTLVRDAHSTFSTRFHKGEDIIDQNNKALAKKYVTLRTTQEVIEKEFQV